MSITIKNLTKSYKSQKALDNFSLTVEQGRVMGLLGPNGAGKSTLIKILTGYILPDDGEITVCGLKMPEDKIKIQQIVGYLPESNPCYVDLYVKEYLEYVAGIYHVPSIKNRIDEVLSLVQLTSEAYKKIGSLSKGYRQRVGLAQAIIHNPKVLILDEPTTGFDPNQMIEIRALIGELSKEKTVILSTHLLQEVEAVCHDVVIVHHGKKIIDGNIQNIKQSNESVVDVAFFEPLSSEILHKIKQCFKTVVFQDNKKHITITTSGDVELTAKQIFEFAVQHHQIITTLKSETHNLEQIFHTLTT